MGTSNFCLPIWQPCSANASNAAPSTIGKKIVYLLYCAKSGISNIQLTVLVGGASNGSFSLWGSMLWESSRCMMNLAKSKGTNFRKWKATCLEHCTWEILWILAKCFAHLSLQCNEASGECPGFWRRSKRNTNSLPRHIHMERCFRANDMWHVS